jgi:mono/diheme cytochrome c family protein
MLRLFAILVVLGSAGGWWLSAPQAFDELPSAAAGHQADLGNGETLFNAGGCASCHMAPGEEDRLKLAGGLRLESPFGVFVAPNISTHPDDGIGGWTALEFVNAMTRGVSPDGAHYYPAFPYTSYRLMPVADLLDLKAYLDTLPAIAGRAPDHELPFPVSIRRSLGLWKQLNLDETVFVPDPAASDAVNRGAYLTNGPGHCGECHTPRDLLGGMLADQHLAGAPNPEGKGIIPNITPHEDGLKDWSEGDISFALETGFTPDYDSLGGTMGKVVTNMSKLTGEDRAAIAAYLKSLPPLPNGYPARDGSQQ